MTKKPEQIDIEDKPLEKSPTETRANTDEVLAVMDDIIRAYKKLIGFDEPETQKLIREMTKCFITAGTVVRLLNRRKQIKPPTPAV